MSILRPVYRVARSIIISLILLAVVVYGGLYVLLSIPSFQQKVKKTVCAELSGLLGGKLDIEDLTLQPFSEVILKGVSLTSPEGEKCITIGKVASGIDLWTLMAEKKIVLNYAEILGLDVAIEQKSEKGPLNIQFLIDALSPKRKNEPTTKFDLKFRNVVIRDSKAHFLRSWMKDSEGNLLPFSDATLENLRVDLRIPELKNDLFRFDIRNVQFNVDPGFSVRSLSADVTYEKEKTDSLSDKIIIKDFAIKFPNTILAIGDITLRTDSLTDIHADIKGTVTPSDFAQIIADLRYFDTPWNIDVDSRICSDGIEVSNLEFANQELDSYVKMNGSVGSYSKKDSININLNELHADFAARFISNLVEHIPGISDKVKNLLNAAGSVKIDMDARIKDGDNIDASGTIVTDNGLLDFEGTVYSLKTKLPKINVTLQGDDVGLGQFLDTEKLGNTSFNMEAQLVGIDKKAEGKVVFTSDAFDIMGKHLSKAEIIVDKKKEDVDIKLETSGDDMHLDMAAIGRIAGINSEVKTDINIHGFTPSDFGIKGKIADCSISTNLQAHARGNNADNLLGSLKISDLTIYNSGKDKLTLSELDVKIDSIGSSDIGGKSVVERKLTLTSDWIDGKVEGYVNPGTVAKEIKKILSSVLPTLIPSESLLGETEYDYNDFKFDFKIKGVAEPYIFFNTPVRPLSDIPVSGEVDTRHGKLGFELNTPHLLQGKNKLIRDIALSFSADSYLGMAKTNLGAIYPTKKGEAQIAADLYASADKVRVDIGFNPTMESRVKGNISLISFFDKIADPFNPKGEIAVHTEMLPSTITISDKTWQMADSRIDYSGKKVSVSNFRISHDDQFIAIDGIASESPNDKIKVKLNDIDLEYIFNILNINYVSFGGMATGEVEGSMLLAKRPVAYTDFLRVKDLSYNGAVLGDGDLASEYDSDSQKVGIYAVIRDPLTRKRKASVDGGIWVTRDSLSFNMDADKINIELMKPFVVAFCSELSGKASGKCKLYGTFSDIDLVGALKADTLSMKLDFTNTWYHAGNDSVFLRTGLIDIPPLTLYDDEGHTAEFSGWLRHRYFHEPVFNFRVRDAKSLLCFNTNEKINPLWYGTIYGTGHAQINGYPGQIEIDMNMTSEDNSKFYYVISDAEEVDKYSFLTFTDRRKEQIESVRKDSVPAYLNEFLKNKTEEESISSNVILSLKGTVTNDALVTLVMDPKAGDNITARGFGALQMDYNLANNDLRMIGSYVLDEGNYNFSLQDIIIKNFTIKKGSMITFDGDPMNANLDITATYRVNTNLTDLDKSFSTDRELNRTNVPVDALLMVKGPMTHPDITFDIELPSLTSDVERKVKSIVSTNDMMSRQIIYLLALNRFYTPEYTESSGSNSGSEWSSMASSTISSQLSNILSQMTDKLDMAPSFRSDKGDFTDMEFDLALSSRLLNNRLLINGNFGYRDRSTSNTQFVGDFDIEYLLSKNGNLRLKAYNHFNDQNYYLRSAQTTQGVGVVFRKDFDHLFPRNKKDENGYLNDKTDSLKVPYEIVLEKDSINK